MRRIAVIGIILTCLVCGVNAFDYDVIYNSPGMYTWVVPEGLESIDVLVVGGGGGGASGGHRTSSNPYGGGGGGAGQVRELHITNVGDQMTHGPGGLDPGIVWDCNVGMYGSFGEYDGGWGDTSSLSSNYGLVYAIGGNGGAYLESNTIAGLDGDDGYTSITPAFSATKGAGGNNAGMPGIGAGGGGGGGASNAGAGGGPDWQPGGMGACGIVAIKYNYPYTPPPPAPTIQWSPETGYYMGYWFNRNADFINVEGLFSSILLPFTALIGQWFFMIVWGTIVMGMYLHTQDTTLPFVIGILLGAVMSISAGAEGATIMYLTMAFAGGGVLAKLLLGRS